MRLSDSTTEFDVPQTLRLEDAPQTEPQAVPEESRPRNPRDEAMARIAARYEEQTRAQELAYGETLNREAVERGATVDPSLAEPPPVEQEPAADAAPAEQETHEHPAAAPEPAPAPAPVQHVQQPQLRQVMLGGQPVVVTDEQFAHLANIGALAMQQARAAPQPAPAPVQPPRAPELSDDRAKAIANRLSYGTPDEQAAALKEWHAEIAAVAQPAAPPIDPERIKAEAVATVMQQWELNHNLGVIGQEFPQIFNSRPLSHAAAFELDAIRRADAMRGVQRPNLEVYREACNNVLEGLPPTMRQSQSGQEAQQPAAPQAAPMVVQPTARIERKRAAPRNPAAVSRVASMEQAPRPPTNSEIIDRMRRDRGQMPLH